MKKIYLRTMVAVLLLLCSTVASAHRFEVGGIYYNIISSSDLTVEVTYKGNNPSSYDDEYSSAVVIPQTVTYNSKTYSVTTIGEYAFYNCTGLTSVTIPNSVTTIGYEAFYKCTGLTSVTIPNSVTTIGHNAFYNTAWYNNQPDGLVYAGKVLYKYKGTMPQNTSIVIKDGTLGITDYAFIDCTDLTSIEIPSSVTTIGYGAFYNCTGLTSITIPNSVTTIEYCAFKGCYGLTNITIPNSVTTIGYGAFSDCTGLTSITIPGSVTTIGGYAFSGCTGLTSIIVEEGNAVYDSRENCNAIIETQTNTLIAGCKRTIIPSDITKINDYAFWNCTGLTSIKIPGSVTAIGNYAFNGCTGFTSVTIPNSVTTIGDYAFSYCTDLTDVYCHATTVPETSSNAFNNSNATNATLHVPATAIESYRATAPWSNFGTIVAIEGSEENKNLLDLGACGDNLTCAIDTVKNKLYINGTGDMYDFDYNNPAPWYNYRGEITSVSINDGVTTIGAYAFDGCYGLTSITIPNSVTNIGEWAFYNCTDLTSVTIPNSVTTIGDYAFGGCYGITSVTIGNGVTTIGAHAFYDCTGLTSVTIPNSVTTIGYGAFYDCTGLTSITIPNSVTTIGDRAFWDCTGLTSVTIPNSVTTIGDRAFYYCTGLTSISVEKGNAVYDSRENCNAIIETQTNTLIKGCKNTIIPNSVTSIGDYAFLNCTGLTSVTIPNSVTTIGRRAFYYCTGLTSVTIPNSVTTIGDNAFSYCDGLTSITIGNSVTTIGNWAFISCTGLTSVTIPNSVTTIGDYAFGGCYGLTSVTIPNSVTTIGDFAFSDCTGLTSVTIPNSVTTIGYWAFYKCTNLTDLYCHATTVPETRSDAFDNSNATNATLHVPATAIESYRATAPWSDFGTIVAIEGSEENKNLLDLGACGDNLTCAIDTVENKLYINGTGDMYDFEYNKPVPWYNYREEITSVSINDGVTTIGAYAFGCYGITSITIPNSVTTIGRDAFYECTGLTSVTIPNSVTNIGDYAFSNCKGLTSITVEGGNAVYDSRENCNAIIETQTNTLIAGCKNTIIPNSVTSIGKWAFNGCTGLTSVTIPNSVTTIGGFAFWGCDGLTSITVEGGNAVYDSRENCNAIIETQTNTLIAGCKNTIIPNSVTSIGKWAFNGCTGLASITIPNSVTTIEYGAFYNCYSLTSVTIGNGVTTIGDHAFEFCTGLKSIEIPGSVTSIGDYAFQCCHGLASITIPNSVTTIEYGAFYNCYSLTSVTIGNGVTTIGDHAFEFCTGLKSIEIPGSVTSIGSAAFRGYTNLTDVYCFATTVPETSSNAFDNSNATNATLHVPATAIESYRATAPWSDFGTIVAIEESEEDGDEPSITTGEAIDLGLPSGIKWASCNIGATAPEEYGGYYAWGETEEKDSYDWSTYKWCNGTKYSMTKYCTNSNYGTVDNKTTLDPKDDVAHVKWGGNWRMPTLTEQQELIDNCVWVWTTINDVIGYNVTGPNGNSIFLPAAGFRSQKATKAQGSAAHYWTGSLNGDNSSAFAFYFYNKGQRCISNYRDRGHTVRPVYDDGSSTSIEIITPEVNNENTIYDLRGQKLTEITAPGIYIVNGKKVIVK